MSERNQQETVQKLGATNTPLRSMSEMLAEIDARQKEGSELQEQNQQETVRELGVTNTPLRSMSEMLAGIDARQKGGSELQEQNQEGTVRELGATNTPLRSMSEMLAEINAGQTEGSKYQGQNHKKTAQKPGNAIKHAGTGAGETEYLPDPEYSSARYYQNSFERGFLIPMFDYMDRADFEEKYLALIHGMDSLSIREINKILSRVAMVKAKPDQVRYNFYSVSEQEERTKLRTDFENRILRISDNLYAYDKYLLPIRHFEICVFLHKHGIELVRDKESIWEKDMIDAGGFIGDSALVLSDYTDKRIFSFEANPKNFDLLKKTLEINNLSKVVPVQKALWSSETELEMHVQGSCSSFTEVGGIQYVNGTVKVPTITLDRFVKRRRLRVGLIKVDLEGAELEFLKGAEHTIRTQKPVLLLSIYHKPSDFFELKPLLEQWVPEYEFFVFNPVDWGILLETMIVAQPRLPLSQTP